MVVGYAHPMCLTRCPAEHKPPLVGDADAVVPPQVAAQGFQAIARWRGQVLKNLRGVDHVQFPEGDRNDVGWQTPRSLGFPAMVQILCGPVPEGRDHVCPLDPALYRIHGYRVNSSPAWLTPSIPNCVI